MGVEFGFVCVCGFGVEEDYTSGDMGTCDTQCAGDESLVCGKPYSPRGPLSIRTRRLGVRLKHVQLQYWYTLRYIAWVVPRHKKKELPGKRAKMFLVGMHSSTSVYDYRWCDDKKANVPLVHLFFHALVHLRWLLLIRSLPLGW